MNELTIAVVGSAETGKSTFIRLALERSKPLTTPVAVGKVTLGGQLHRLHLVEFNFDEVDFGGGQRLAFPTTARGIPISSVDGVVCLWDLTQEDSIGDVPEFLNACVRSKTSAVTVAWKVDARKNERQVPPSFADRLENTFPSITVCEGSQDEANSGKLCMLSILKLINERNEHVAGRLSAKMTRSRHQSHEISSSAKQHSIAHARAASELPEAKVQLSKRSSASSDKRPTPDRRPSPLKSERQRSMPLRGLALDTTTQTPRNSRGPAEPQTPPSSTEYRFHEPATPSDSREPQTPRTPESLYMRSALRPGTSGTVDDQAPGTFLDVDSVTQEDSETSSSEASPKLDAIAKGSDTPKDEFGNTFEELVDRLLTLPKSKQQVKFEPMFLCLYRAFATPLQVLDGILSRFDRMEKSKDVRLIQAGEQLRYLQVLARWTADYPEDFTMVLMRSKLAKFLSTIRESKIFMGAAKEILNNLQAETTDEDLDWAYTDLSYPAPHPKARASGSKVNPHPGTKVRRPSVPSSSESAGSREPEAESSSRHSGTSSTSSNLARATHASSQSLANLAVLDHARHKATKLRPVPRTRLSKIQWHQLMETPSEEFAREVTRIDWTMYRAIRPRDFVRHVVLSSEGKKLSQQPDNIGIMVKQFNHLALFVSGMILLRDKPKHRAKMLEKLIDVAWKVRQLNNYNSLGAIVAGINGPEIQRLGMTRELVPAQVQKDFLRLTILMSHSRSHTAYRMAWDNSSAERIPFIPLIRQDLTKAEMGNRTWVGPDADRIHWKKFQVMGEVVLGLQESQQKQYNFPKRNEDLTKMILETRVLEGSEASLDPGETFQIRSQANRYLGRC